MIDLIQLHDVLRFSGFGPDVPFHMTESGHELKLRKLADELEESGVFAEYAEEIRELEEQVAYLEGSLEEAS